MPLTGESFTSRTAAEWVASKDAQWERHGFGPWAILVDGAFAGWGGFQAEAGGADFGLVLDPHYWGQGRAIARLMLDRGFGEFGLDEVVIALPYSRSPDRAVARWGFTPDGEASYDGTRFRQYRLSRAVWERPDGPRESV